MCGGEWEIAIRNVWSRPAKWRFPSGGKRVQNSRERKRKLRAGVRHHRGAGCSLQSRPVPAGLSRLQGCESPSHTRPRFTILTPTLTPSNTSRSLRGSPQARGAPHSGKAATIPGACPGVVPPSDTAPGAGPHPVPSGCPQTPSRTIGPPRSLRAAVRGSRTRELVRKTQLRRGAPGRHPQRVLPG